MSVKDNITDIMTLHSKTPGNIELGASGCSENASICIFVSSFLAIGSLLFPDFIAG